MQYLKISLILLNNNNGVILNEAFIYQLPYIYQIIIDHPPLFQRVHKKASSNQNPK